MDMLIKLAGRGRKNRQI